MRSPTSFPCLAFLLTAFLLLLPRPSAAGSSGNSPPSAKGSTPAIIRVAVAANFKSTLLKINAAFTDKTGVQIKVSSASTGVLAQQVLHGAPFDVFFSADFLTPVKVLGADKKPAANFFCYAIGRLALLGGNGALDVLAQPTMSLAIANPVTAPYGRAATEVLNRTEFVNGQSRKLVRGNNTAQAFQFWSTGAVDLALIPLALAPDKSVPIPAQWHTPLKQYVLILQRNAVVDAYIKWVRSDNVRTLIQQAGYYSCL